MPPQRRLAISERERQKIRQYARANPRLRQTDIARWASNELGHKISQSIICKSLRPKWSYLDTKTFGESESGTLRAYKPDYPLLESALCEWIMHMEAIDVSVTGEMIQGAARSLWKKMPDFQGLKEPAWSQGWLSGFKRRHKIKPSTYKPSGEATSVNTASSVGDAHRLQQMLKRFSAKDIFTADETGLCWLTTLEEPLPTKPRSDGKKQNTITILPTCNADGSEKLDLWVVGHVEYPCSFGPGRRFINNLPFKWRHNKKAWMTTAIFIEYLHWFDEQMQGRNVLLLLDRFSAHVNAVGQLRDGVAGLGLKNTTVEFIPAGPTYIVQPMDQGIIHSMKAHYRKAWLQHVISLTMEDKDSTQNTTILSAAHWIIDAWRSVTADTIAHSWRYSQLFGSVARPSNQPLHHSAATHLHQLVEVLIREGVRGIANVNNFVNPPEEAINDSYEDLIDHIAETFSETPDGKDSVAVEQQAAHPVSVAEALKAVNRLIQFEEQQDNASLATLAQLRRSQSRITQLSLRNKSSIAETLLHL